MEGHKRQRVELVRDVYQIIVAFLPLNDLKTISLVNKNMLKTARRELVSRTNIVVKGNENSRPLFLHLRAYSPVIPFPILIDTLDELQWFMKNNFDLYNIKFGNYFSAEITVDMLPHNIKILTLGHDFNQSIQLPQSLQTLTFGAWFNQPIVLPQSLHILKFGFHFNQSIQLPQSLQTLCFGAMFNQPLNALPHNLQILTFGHNFNHPIVLPQSLKVLIFGNRFEQQLDLLPQNLQTLILGNNFIHPIILPQNLLTLKFGLNFNQPLELPPNLQTLEVSYEFNQPIQVPQNLRVLTFSVPQSFELYPPLDHLHYVETIQRSYPNLNIEYNSFLL